MSQLSGKRNSVTVLKTIESSGIKNSSVLLKFSIEGFAQICEKDFIAVLLACNPSTQEASIGGSQV
jgi:hypothetical protein